MNSCQGREFTVLWRTSHHSSMPEVKMSILAPALLDCTSALAPFTGNGRLGFNYLLKFVCQKFKQLGSGDSSVGQVMPRRRRGTHIRNQGGG